MKKIRVFFAVLVFIFAGTIFQSASAQVKLEDLQNLNLGDILGKTKILKVKKGYNPVFTLGSYQVNTVG